MLLSKSLKRVFAVSAAILLLLTMLAGCGNNEPAATEPESTTTACDSTAPVTETTTEAATEAATELTTAATTETPAETSTAAPASSSTTAATTVRPTTTRPPVTTTAKPTAPAKPGTTAEIVAYFNAAANKVKADKPGYTYKARTVIDEKRVSSPNRLLDKAAPPILSMVKGFWANWTPDEVIAKGGDHSEFPVAGQSQAGKLEPSWVKSAVCTEKGGVYDIKIVLKDERVPALPAERTSTKHGQLVAVFTKAEIADGASRLGVKITQFDALYSGCYVQCTVDKAAGSMKSATYYLDMTAELTARVPVLGSISATIPIAQESVYAIN